MPQSLQAEDIRTLTQPARSLLKAGLVFVAHRTEGKTRHARIHLEGDRQYLCSLQNQTVPLGAAIIQVGEALLSSACLTCPCSEEVLFW